MATAYDNWKLSSPADDGDDRVAQALDSLRADPAMVREADEWMWGDQSPEHYNEVESALADLHSIDPSGLLASDLLARLYQLAKVHGDARTERLLHIAQDKLARQDAEEREIAAGLASWTFDERRAA